MWQVNKKKMIISTGMATISNVFDAVEAIRSVGNNNIVVLQCTTNYPSLIEDANLLAMKSIREACGVEIGYSDHVQNNFACYAAVALGAKIIEKHFTLDKNMPGPDHSSSLNPEEFKGLVSGIRQIEKSLGSSIKKPTIIESKNIYGMKRSLVAEQFISKGTIITHQHVGFKRPANGLEVNMIDQIIGKEVVKDIEKDEPFQFNYIKMVTKKSLFIKQITVSDLDVLKDFIYSSGDSLKTFRFYEKRDFKIISDHILTVLLFFNNKAIA